MGKTALIVDDSKSARVVLKRVLETHALDVATAESAEDALIYLNDNRPDVIFMDHLMPGMDGFEAVSAIKNNPATATIPIMMYTSQQGEVYVGQARALGAVGVLPKQVEPVEVSKVLESLRVIGAEAERRKYEDYAESIESTDEYPGLESFDQDLRVLITDLFNQQRALLQRDLRAGYREIAARVVNEIRPPEAGDDTQDVESLGLSASAGTQWAFAAVAVIALVFLALFIDRTRIINELQQNNAGLQQELDEQLSLEAAATDRLQEQLANSQRSAGSQFLMTLQALEWGVNQSATYAYDEIPLGDARLNLVEEMFDQLLAVNFTGVIRIETHVGDFCMTTGGAAGYRLASPDVPVSQCTRLGYEPEEAQELGLRQSVAFANFVNGINARSGGIVRFEIVSNGNATPVLAYPAASTGMTAGAWNDIAASNNRIEVSLYPDTL